MMGLFYPSIDVSLNNVIQHNIVLPLGCYILNIQGGLNEVMFFVVNADCML